MSQPVIGLTIFRSQSEGELMRAKINESYIEAVLGAEAIPLLIPVGIPTGELPGLLTRLDGFIFTGGGDIDPVLFNGKPHLRVDEIDPGRDEIELALFHLLVEAKKPFLAICRGCQVMNVALGGTLYTHIQDQHPGAIRHDWWGDSPRDYLAHSVRLQEGSRLAAIMGESNPQVNSLHHQGVEKVAAGLVSTAFAPDGLVEGLEISGYPFGIGVQWHPECLPASAPNRALFKALVRASNGR